MERIKKKIMGRRKPKDPSLPNRNRKRNRKGKGKGKGNWR